MEQHQQFESLREQLFACVDQLRHVQLIDSQTLGFKLSQLDDAQSVQASLRQQLDQQHAELSRLKNDAIRFETENAGLKRDVQVIKNDARTRQAKQQDEVCIRACGLSLCVCECVRVRGGASTGHCVVCGVWCVYFGCVVFGTKTACLSAGGPEVHADLHQLFRN